MARLGGQQRKQQSTKHQKQAQQAQCQLRQQPQELELKELREPQLKRVQAEASAKAGSALASEASGPWYPFEMPPAPAETALSANTEQPAFSTSSATPHALALPIAEDGVHADHDDDDFHDHDIEHMLGDEPQSIFRPFTRESLATQLARLAEEAAKKAQLEKMREEGIEPEPQFYHHKEAPDPDPGLEAGGPLPKQIVNDFPPELIATPVEEIDKYYENKRTFMVISKGKDIFRFSSTNALWILSPFNPIRRLAICILVHPLFSFFIIVAILVNCVLMTMPANDKIEQTE